MKKVLDFTVKHKNVVLATVDGDKPKLRVFQIMKQVGASFYFTTNKEKEVYTQLQRNCNVEFIAVDGNVSVRVAGHAFFDVPEDVAIEIYRSNPILKRFHDSYKTIAYFGVKAEKIDYYDLGTDPVTFESVSLA